LKITFRKVKDATMFKSNHMELDKITLAGCVDQAIDQSLMKKNIKVGLKATSIWSFNPKAMDNKTRPLEIYTTRNINNHGCDQEEYTSDEQTDYNKSQQWREKFTIVELFQIAKTLVHQTTLEDHPTNMLKFDQHYYVDMPQNPTVIKKKKLEEIINLNEITLELVQETQSPPN